MSEHSTLDGLKPHEQAAVEYLRAQLGEHAPDYLRFEREVDERPLETEGRSFVFSFPLTPPGGETCAKAGAAANAKHYVVVGETEPNYFPAYELDSDDAYSFHVGTQFMLMMELRLVDPADEPPNARRALRRFVAEYAKGAACTDEKLAALFRTGDEAHFAVYSLRLNDQDVYCMGADCPPGFYRMTQAPPQAALRLHLGKVIRNEAREARRRAAEESEA